MAGKKKPRTYEFRTVAEMHAVPVEKVDAFCEDLRLYLRLARMAEASGLAVLNKPDVFGWIDDGKHDPHVNIHVNVVDHAGEATR